MKHLLEYSKDQYKIPFYTSKDILHLKKVLKSHYVTMSTGIIAKFTKQVGIIISLEDYTAHDLTGEDTYYETRILFPIYMNVQKKHIKNLEHKDLIIGIDTMSRDHTGYVNHDDFYPHQLEHIDMLEYFPIPATIEYIVKQKNSLFFNFENSDLDKIKKFCYDALGSPAWFKYWKSRIKDDIRILEYMDNLKKPKIKETIEFKWRAEINAIKLGLM